MMDQQETITRELNPQTAHPDSSYSTSKKTTVVESYPVASQSTLNVDGTDHNDDFHLELRPTEESAEPIRQGWISYSRERWMVGCFAVMTMMVALDAMILVPILPDISEKYQSDSSRGATWPITVYFLTNAALQRFCVAAMQIFGRRNVLLGGLILFSIGLILLSAAPPLFPVLLVGRGIQGAGVAAMVSVPPAMLKEMVRAQRRPYYNCVILSCGAFGATLGSILGGAFMMQKSTAWRWVFYISSPFCIALYILVPFAIQPVGEILRPKKSITTVDWTGMSIFSASMAALLLGLTWASSLQKELEWKVLVALAAGAVGLIVTMLYERSGASRPFLPFSIFKISPTTFICVFIHSLIMAVQLVYIPAYLRGVHHSSPVSIGAFSIALVLPLLLATAGVGLIPTETCHFRYLLGLGWALNIITCGCLILLGTATKPGVCAILIIFTGLGHGITISATHRALRVLSIQKTQSTRDAFLIANFVRTVGFCLAISGGESVFQTRMNAYYTLYTLTKVYADTFDDLMRALTTLAGIGGLLSLFVGWKKNRS